MDSLFGFVLAGIALAGSPGPATLSLAATGAAFGARRGLGYMAGLAAGMVAVMAVVASGVVGLLLALPGAVPVVTALAAGYFLYLAWRIGTAPPISAADGRRRPPGVAGGVILSLLNPKGYAAMTALYSGFVLVPASLAIDIAAKMAVLAAIIVAVNLAWLVAGAQLTRRLADPRASRAINLCFAVLLLASVAIVFAF